MASLQLEPAYFTNAKGVFELRKIEVSRSSNRLRSGRCCGNVPSSGKPCLEPCLMHLDVCLRPFDIEGSRDCVVRGFSSVLLEGNSTALEEQKAAISFSISWPGAFALFLKGISNSSNESDNVVFEAFFADEIKPNRTWTARLHNSTQISLQFDSRLICSDDYFGPYCSVHCVDRNDMFGHWKCDQLGQRVCLAGWNGTYCTDPICEPPCQNGSCQDNGYERYCQCDPGRSGRQCERCTNHAACGHGICSNNVCTCPAGWGGPNCSKITDFCFLNKPCLNGGTCRNLDGSRKFECECAFPYHGTVCETHLTSCSPHICQNGGTCQVREGNLSCICAPKFTGKLCQKHASPCDLQPCMNNGTCVEERSIRSCICPQGIFGADCEHVAENSVGGFVTGISIRSSYAAVAIESDRLMWAATSMYSLHSIADVLPTTAHNTEINPSSTSKLYESNVNNVMATSPTEPPARSFHFASLVTSSGRKDALSPLSMSVPEDMEFSSTSKDSLPETSTLVLHPTVTLISRPSETPRSSYLSEIDSSVPPGMSWIRVHPRTSAKAISITVTTVPATTCVGSCQDEKSTIFRVVTGLSVCASLLVLLVIVTLLLWKRSKGTDFRKGVRRSWHPNHSSLPRCVITMGRRSIVSKASPPKGVDNKAHDRDSGTYEDPPIGDVTDATNLPAESQNEIEEVSLEPAIDFERYTVQAVDRICMQAIREVRQKNRNLIQETSFGQGNVTLTIESPRTIRTDLTKTHSNASRISQASSGYYSSASRSNSRAGSAQSGDKPRSKSLLSIGSAQTQINLPPRFHGTTLTGASTKGTSRKGTSARRTCGHDETTIPESSKPKANHVYSDMSKDSPTSDVCHNRRVFKEAYFDGLPNYVMCGEEGP